jgi:hypothetical protein
MKFKGLLTNVASREIKWNLAARLVADDDTLAQYIIR